MAATIYAKCRGGELNAEGGCGNVEGGGGGGHIINANAGDDFPPHLSPSSLFLRKSRVIFDNNQTTTLNLDPYN